MQGGEHGCLCPQKDLSPAGHQPIFLNADLICTPTDNVFTLKDQTKRAPFKHVSLLLRWIKNWFTVCIGSIILAPIIIIYDNDDDKNCDDGDDEDDGDDDADGAQGVQHLMSTFAYQYQNATSFSACW